MLSTVLKDEEIPPNQSHPPSAQDEFTPPRTDGHGKGVERLKEMFMIFVTAASCETVYPSRPDLSN